MADILSSTVCGQVETMTDKWGRTPRCWVPHAAGPLKKGNRSWQLHSSSSAPAATTPPATRSLVPAWSSGDRRQGAMTRKARRPVILSGSPVAAAFSLARPQSLSKRCRIRVLVPRPQSPAMPSSAPQSRSAQPVTPPPAFVPTRSLERLSGTPLPPGWPPSTNNWPPNASRPCHPWR
jgi:hypothetical protein